MMKVIEQIINMKTLDNILPIIQNITINDLDLNINTIFNNEEIVSNDFRYIRKKLASNNNFDVYLIKWLPYCESAIHDHPDNGCFFKILDGEIIEEVYSKNLNVIDTNYYMKSNFGKIHDDIGYHKMINKSNKECISLHVYSPSNYKTNNYK